MTDDRMDGLCPFGAHGPVPDAELLGAEDRGRGAYWARRRGLGRVVRDYLVAGSPVYLTRRDDVLAALRDPETFKPDVPPFDVTMSDGQQIEPVPLSLSPKDHARVVSDLYPSFTAKSVAPFGDAIRAHAPSLIADVAPLGRCEAVRDDLVHLFSHGAFLTVCGIGHEHLPEINALVRTPGVENDGTVQHRLLEYLVAGLASGYRRRPGILWDLIDAVDDGGSLSRRQFFGLLLLLLGSGSQSTVDAVQFALLRLARDAQLRRQLREYPELVGRFVEEVVRLSGSAVSGARITTREVTVGDVTVPAGTRVWLCLESASREEGGDEFLITGRPKRHWGFGGGIHRCLGAHLARLEMTTFVAEWLRQIPEFDVEPGFQPAVDDISVLTALPLKWDAQSGDGLEERYEN